MIEVWYWHNLICLKTLTWYSCYLDYRSSKSMQNSTNSEIHRGKQAYTQNIQQEMFSIFQQDVGILPIPFRARPHLSPRVLSILSWLWRMLSSLQASGRQPLVKSDQWTTKPDSRISHTDITIIQVKKCKMLSKHINI